MSIFFSSANRGFYDDALKHTYAAAGTWPDDAVEVTEQDWRVFSGAAPAYKVPAVDVHGGMRWIDNPEIDIAAAISQRNTVTRDGLLRTVAGDTFVLQMSVDTGIATEPQVAQLAANQRYAVALMTMNDLSEAVPVWPERDITQNK